MKVNSLSGLEDAIDTAISRVMPKVGNRAEFVVKEEIDASVYGSYSPSVYNRTGGLKNSITNKQTKSNEVEVYHDTSRINAYSLKTGGDVSSFLPNIVHDTGAPNIFNAYDGYAWQSPRPYMLMARNRLDNGEIADNMRGLLRAAGYKVK